MTSHVTMELTYSCCGSRLKCHVVKHLTCKFYPARRRPCSLPLNALCLPNTCLRILSHLFLYSYLLGSKLCRKEFLTFSRVLEECWACSRLTDMNHWRHGYWALHPVDSGKASFSPETNSAWGPLSLGRAYVTALGVWTLTSFIMNSPM